ncbi:MAG: inosine/xanthosine triphosphatase [Candidatus Methanomethylophilaceae archaeon]|nr:inosine/xanthosine triphosphatase [Candidatus Methanomethylophilaceae archaeon]
MKVAAVAGTFNVIHDGHRALLREAFSRGDRVLVGITSDAMAAEGRAEYVPLSIREPALRRELDGMGEYDIYVIDDLYGPPEMDSVDVLVVSEETRGNAELINESRISRGVPPLEIDCIPLLMGDSGKISASEILRGDYGSSGRRDVLDVAVGSANRVKVEAVRSVLARIYGDVRVTPMDVPSGVPPQPFESDVRRGSENRARAALPGHDMAVGIEAGVFEMEGGLYDIQHCTIIDRDGKLTHGQGSGFRYPDTVADLVRKGMTVGEAMREVYGESNIGKGRGAIGLLSKGLLDRKTLTEQAVIAAMIPRIWDERYVLQAQDNGYVGALGRVQAEREGGEPHRPAGRERAPRGADLLEQPLAPGQHRRHAHRRVRRRGTPGRGRHRAHEPHRHYRGR